MLRQMRINSVPPVAGGNVKLSVTKEFTFDAAHYLPGYDGPCAQMHGHTYRLQVTVRREDLLVGSDGMVIDFALLSQVIRADILSRLDHRCLNEALEFRPTAENMAAWIFCEIQNRLPGEMHVVEVKLWETPTSFATASRL